MLQVVRTRGLHVCARPYVRSFCARARRRRRVYVYAAVPVLGLPYDHIVLWYGRSNTEPDFLFTVSLYMYTVTFCHVSLLRLGPPPVSDLFSSFISSHRGASQAQLWAAYSSSGEACRWGGGPAEGGRVPALRRPAFMSPT